MCKGMLGGPVYIALIRFTISFAGTIILFSLMSEPRFPKKKMAVCYGCFGFVLILMACIWYIIDWKNCVKMVAFVMYICFGIFAVYMSKDQICLSLYKLALTFYLLAVFLIGGIEVSLIFFGGNVWADIIVRIIIILVMVLFIN